MVIHFAALLFIPFQPSFLSMMPHSHNANMSGVPGFDGHLKNGNGSAGLQPATDRGYRNIAMTTRTSDWDQDGTLEKKVSFSPARKKSMRLACGTQAY